MGVKMFWKLLIVWIVIGQLPLYVTAQESVVSLEIKDGLSQGMIFDILEDRDGYMWFATFNGLNRYNGYEFDLVSYIPFAKDQLESTETISMEEDSEGRIWIGTESTGLFYRNPITQRIFPVVDEQTGRKYEYVPQIVIDSADRIWFMADDKLYRIDKPSMDQKAPVVATAVSIHRLDESLSFKLEINYKGQFRLVNGGHIVYRYDEQTTQMVIEQVFDETVRDVGFEANDLTWYTDDTHLTVMHKGAAHRFAFPDHLSADEIYIFYAPSMEVIWLAFKLEPRLYCIDFKEAAPQLAVCLTLPEHIHPSTVLVANHKIWIGTKGFGVRYIDLNKPQFEHLAEGKTVRWIGEIADQQMAFSSRSPVHYLPSDRKTNQKLKGKINEYPDVRSIVPSQRHDGYWLLFGPNSYDNTNRKQGVIFIDTVGNLVQKWEIESMDIQYGAYAEDAQGRLWLGGSRGVFVSLSVEQKEPTFFRFSESQASASVPLYVAHIYIDDHQRIWKSSLAGLEVLDLQAATPQQQYRLYQNDNDNPKSLSSNSISAVADDLQSPNKYLWVTTLGGGLNKLNKQTGECTYFGTKDGFPDNIMYGIIPYQDKFWISTNRGLIAYNPTTKGLQHFTSVDGLQHDEFNLGAAYYSPYSDKIYFGGINGITAFSPTALRRIFFTPPLHLEYITIYNTAAHPSSTSIHMDNQHNIPLNALDNITLNWKQNQFSITYAALSYTKHAIKYRYQLSGLQPYWVYAGENRQASFNNLKPGHYTFIVENTNSLGEWSGTPRQIQITITPPWWATRWAYLLYTLAAISLFVMAIQRYSKRLISKHDAHQKDKVIHRLKALDKLKAAFYDNITHELRTPLQLIIAPLKQAIDHDAPYETSVELAYQSAEYLKRQINELIDLAKLNSNNPNISIHPEPHKLQPYFEDMITRFKPLEHLFNVKLVSHIDIPNDFTALFDPHIWNKIINNILSNAIKFSHEKGEVILNAYVKDQQVYITIQDHGIGIKQKQLQHIFHRFYRTQDAIDHDPQGAGIGLNYTHELVKAINGTINIASKWQEGTTVHLIFPLANAPSTSSVAPTLPPKSETSKPETDAHTILLVEDNTEIRQYISQHLTQLGYQVIQATDGEQGLTLAQSHLPDLILSDGIMPNMDGWQLTQAIKTNFITAHIPVIILTARDSVTSNLKTLEHGADFYLTKPITLKVLSKQIENIFNNIKIRQRYHQQLLLNTPDDQPTPVASPSASDEQFVRTLHQIIREHLHDEHFGVNALSQKVHISRSLLYRKVLAITGLSPSHLIKKLKMAHAKSLLMTGQYAVADVAYRVGFTDAKYFASVYKQEYGHSPSHAPDIPAKP